MGQMRNIIYIINPISGTGSQRDLEKLIEQRSRLAGFDFEIFPSVASGDYSFLLPVIREKKITDVVVAGGDGRKKQRLGGRVDSHLPFCVIFLWSVYEMSFIR